jgi:outer membrane protein OmpA-like peptidoglycan-associated protein
MPNPNSPYGGSSKDTSVNFAYNKSNLLPNQKKELDRMARTINKTGVTKITVRGHADSRGSVSYNMALSRLRAEVTAEYLKTKVKPNVKFIVTSASIKEPIASNQTAKGMSANRRVDIVIPKPPKPPKKLYVGKGGPMVGGQGRGSFGGNSEFMIG